MARAVDWFKNTWSQLKTKFMWQLSQNCSSNSDGCLDVETVLKESPTHCRGSHQTLAWWEVSFLFTQPSQKPELSFCICLIKASFWATRINSVLFPSGWWANAQILKFESIKPQLWDTFDRESANPNPPVWWIFSKLSTFRLLCSGYRAGFHKMWGTGKTEQWA